MKLIAALALAFATFVIPVQTIQAGEVTPEFEKKASQVFDPSVQVKNVTSKKQNGTCSGTVIESKRVDGKFVNKISTARHCAKGTKDKFIVDYHGNDFPAKVFKKSVKTDAMILEIETPIELSAAKLATPEELTSILLSEKVYSASFPLGTSLTYSEGFLGMAENVPNPKDFDYLFIKTNLNIAPGSSGSCLFIENKDHDFVCIGTATAILMPFFYLGYYTPINFTQELLDG